MRNSVFNLIISTTVTLHCSYPLTLPGLYFLSFFAESKNEIFYLLETKFSFPARLLPATSPMTDLAINLCDTSLGSGLTPLPDIKKKLAMDYDSSPSSSDSSTPLSSITNKPKGRKPLMRSITLPFDLGESNKENIPHSRQSPCKSPFKHLVDSPLTLKERKSSTANFQKILQSPESLSSNKTSSIGRTGSMKRNMFAMYEDEDSKDSGYSSQPLADARARKKSRKEEDTDSMEKILANCSPSKEDGFAPLSTSPNSKSTKSSSDGFDLETLPEMSDEEEEAASGGGAKYSSLFSNTILMPRNENKLAKPFQSYSRPSSPPRNPPMLRRAQSCINADSPISREAFKMPEPPTHSVSCLGGSKRKSGGNNFMVERSVSLQERVSTVAKPSFHRSQSENDLNDQRKRACELKDDPNVLPDSSSNYCLPSTANEKHPELRSINCHTMADLLGGNYSSSVRRFR